MQQKTELKPNNQPEAHTVKKFDMDEIKQQYNTSKGPREFFKYAFSFLTLGIGAFFFLGSTRIVKDGEVSLRRTATGKLVLLPPGRHSNFPWEEYVGTPQSLSEKSIVLGPYKIITVDTGFVAQTSNKGKLHVLPEGQYIITDPSHTFQQFISIKQAVKELTDVITTTRDGVSLTLKADVRYVIDNPELALSKMTDITHDIGELAKSNLANIVLNHSWEEFGHATSTSTLHHRSAKATTNEPAPAPDQTTPTENKDVVVDVAVELTHLLRNALAELGIRLMNISITGMEVNDTTLASELAQGAAIKVQTESKFMAANNASLLQGIETEAKVNTINRIAQANAEATGLAATALRTALTDSTPEFRAAFEKEQEIRLIAGANRSTLFHRITPTTIISTDSESPTSAVNPAA